MQTPQQIFSRKELMRKNPITWIVLLALALLFLMFIISPQFLEWQEKTSAIKTNQSKISQLKVTNEALKEEIAIKEIELETVAREVIEEEKQTFPANLNTATIARILEIYALQLENLDTRLYDSHFQLQNLDFGNTKSFEETGINETSVSIKVSSDYQNLREFVLYLQTGEISDRVERGRENKQIATNDYTFLENNLLPVMNIDSIQINQQQADERLLDIEIQGRFFSQYQSNE